MALLSVRFVWEYLNRKMDWFWFVCKTSPLFKNRFYFNFKTRRKKCIFTATNLIHSLIKIEYQFQAIFSLVRKGTLNSVYRYILYGLRCSTTQSLLIESCFEIYKMIESSFDLFHVYFAIGIYCFYIEFNFLAMHEIFVT